MPNITSNKQVIFSKIPSTYPFPGEHLTLRESTIDLDTPLKEGEFLVKLLVLSVDPYMRARMRDPSIKSYFSALALDRPLDGGTVSVVLKSNNEKFKEGDVVSGFGPFQEYAVVSKEAAGAYELRNGPKEIPLTNYVGNLGMPGE